MKIKVLGIDAAFSNVGLALASIDITDPAHPVIEITDLKLIHTEGAKKRPKGVSKSADDMRRAREALKGIQDAIRDWAPDHVIAEVPFGSQSARSAWTLGIALGILASIPNLIEVNPRQVKAVTGEPHADKDWMIDWAINKYPNAPWAMRKLKGEMVQIASTNEHLADATAAIHAGLKTILTTV